MKKWLYLLKLHLLTQYYCHKYKIKKQQGLIIEKGFKVYDKTKVVLGQGAHICKNVCFAGGGTINIGKKTVIFRDSEIHALTNSAVSIGDDCLIAKGAYIINSNHSFRRNELIRKQEPTSADICIGNDVWIAGRVTILKGAKIGNGCVIGAGSVVNKEICEYTIAVGIPCKPIKNR